MENNISPSTILVLGSQGFIGSKLCDYFITRGFNVVGLDVIEQTTSTEYRYVKVNKLNADWDSIFSKVQIDFCINAAGSGNVQTSITNPLLDFEFNTYDVVKILDAIRRNNTFCKYIHISSAAVYGNPKQLPITETDFLNPISPYGYHKLMSEIVCKEYAYYYGLKISIIRPFSVYGNGLKKQILWDFCQKIQNSSANSIQLYGTGNESRDFIHVHDLAVLIDIIIQKSSFNYNIYNAAYGKETTINKIADIFQARYPNISINFSGEERKGDPINWCADVSKIQNLGFSPTINIKDGVNQYINWFGSL